MKIKPSAGRILRLSLMHEPLLLFLLECFHVDILMLLDQKKYTQYVDFYKDDAFHWFLEPNGEILLSVWCNVLCSRHSQEEHYNMFLSLSTMAIWLDASLQSVPCHNKDGESIKNKLDLLKSMKNNDSCFHQVLKQ